MNFLQRTITIVAILGIFSAVIIIFIIDPTMKDIQAFNDRIQIERVALENKYTNRRNVKNIIADLKKITTELSPLMKKMIIQKGDEVAFLKDLEKIAKKNSLAQQIKLSSEINKNKNNIAQKQNITIILSGDYINAQKYINELEKSKYYVTLYGIDVISSKDGPTKAIPSGRVKTTLNGYVYFSI